MKIGCRAYLCEARRALSEPVVDPMYVLSHFALSLNISYTHPVGICPGYLSIPKKILLSKVLLLRFAVAFERPYRCVGCKVRDVDIEPPDFTPGRS
jgi:hypothetical protein